MKKKLLLGLGTLAAVATPIVAVVSCGSDDEEVKTETPVVDEKGTDAPVGSTTNVVYTWNSQLPANAQKAAMLTLLQDNNADGSKGFEIHFTDADGNSHVAVMEDGNNGFGDETQDQFAAAFGQDNFDLVGETMMEFMASLTPAPADGTNPDNGQVSTPVPAADLTALVSRYQGLLVMAWTSGSGQVQVANLDPATTWAGPTEINQPSVHTAMDQATATTKVAEFNTLLQDVVSDVSAEVAGRSQEVQNVFGILQETTTTYAEKVSAINAILSPLVDSSAAVDASHALIETLAANPQLAAAQGSSLTDEDLATLRTTLQFVLKLVKTVEGLNNVVNP